MKLNCAHIKKKVSHIYLAYIEANNSSVCFNSLQKKKKMLLNIDLHVHVRTCADTHFFFLWKDLRKTQPPLVAGLGLNTSPLVLFYDSPRTHLDHLPSFPRPLFLFLPRFSVTFKINVTCRKANPEKKKPYAHG